MADERVVDPAKVDALIAEFEAEARDLERVADTLEEIADEKRREAAKLRAQNVALLEAARRYGYPAPHDSEEGGDTDGNP